MLHIIIYKMHLSRDQRKIHSIKPFYQAKWKNDIILSLKKKKEKEQQSKHREENNKNKK